MAKLTVPKYSLGEEITNSITHGLGVLFRRAFFKKKRRCYTTCSDT